MPNNPLKVSLENIIPLTFARDHFSQIVTEVQKDKLFVLTKGGKPAVAIIDVKYLESITGGEVQKEDIKEEIKKAPEKVGLPPMVEHPSTLQSNSGQASSGQVPPPKPTPPPFKPAGFAAPMPKPFDSTQGKPTSPPPQPRADQPRVEKPVEPPPKPATPGPLEMPMEKPAPVPIPNKPLTTLPPVNPNTQESKPAPPASPPKPASPPGVNQVDIQFAPDEATQEEKAKDGKIPDGEKVAPDDENPPAQYAGGEPEPKDMALD